MSFRFQFVLAIGILAVSLTARAQTDAPGENYAPVKLRGYGALAGVFTPGQIDGQPASVLKIVCENVDKAKLVHAKYLSDLQVLPGVKAGALSIGGKSIPCIEIDRQGAILAARDGAIVYVLAATSDTILAQLGAKTFSADAPSLAFSPEVDVPMFLDRWDKLGFRIGTRPFEGPKGSDFRTYDAVKEFDWVASQGKMGYIFWCQPSQLDPAEGFVENHFVDWIVKAARDRNVSVEVNLYLIQAQLWLANRYRSETAQKMPGYVGSFYKAMDSFGGGQGVTSWNSTLALDISLSEMQETVRRFAKEPNVVGWQEPHSELRHGNHDFLMEYGALANDTFREWLKNKYHTPEAVAKRWGMREINAWSDVQCPELASFMGWGPEALDLTGPWKVSYPDITVTANQPIAYPAETFAPEFDDSAWPEVVLPGHDHAMFTPSYKPGVFRRTFDVSGAWLKANPKAWLYILDMNNAWDQNIVVTLNGKEVGRSPVRKYVSHVDGYDVTAALKEGTNKLAVALPSGFIAYRAYLSGSEPREYPDLGANENARWVDFVDWMDGSRVQAVQRGVEMIRQIDPDRDIYLASPRTQLSDLISVAERYGCTLHDTGSMSASWQDDLPSLIAGAGLPMTVEPGNGFTSVNHERGCLGRWSTEGLQSVDYIQNAGEIYWHDDIRAEFEAHLNDWHLIGKYRVPAAEWATLYSSRVTNLSLFPWGKNSNLNLATGHPLWDWDSDFYPHAGITDHDLVAGNGDKYRVLIDSNTSIMDPDMIDAIERYVRQGGIFVTFVQTGRHTETQPNSWPISKLTGYSVTAIDPHDAAGTAAKRKLHLLPGQDIFPAEQWRIDNAFGDANGLSLKKEAPECQDLMQWDDGSIAAGMRPLGKGFIFDLGVKFSNNKIWSGNRDATDRMFNEILAWAKLKREPAQLENVTSAAPADPNAPPTNRSEFDVFHRPGDAVKFRHYISNNGLYDVWAVWNMKDQAVSGAVHFIGISPGAATEVRTGNAYPVDTRADGSQDLKFQLVPNETRNFLTPHGQIAAAASGWFELQRDWWKGTATPPDKTLPSIDSMRKFTLALDGQWATRTLAATDDPAALSAPDLDDAAWEHHDDQAPTVALVPVIAPADPPRHALYRKRFTVPAAWNRGRISLWIQAWVNRTLWDRGRIYCDGKMIRDWCNQISGDDFSGILTAGTHLLAIEIEGRSPYFGNSGHVWLSYLPEPAERLDLAGVWPASDDALHFDTQATLPGPWDTFMVRKHLAIDAAHKDQNVVFHFEGSGPMEGVVINGKWLRRFHHHIGAYFDINLTPWIHFGADNELEIVLGGGKGKATVQKCFLYFYPQGNYP